MQLNKLENPIIKQRFRKMNTVLSYFEDTYKFEDYAIINSMGKDENGGFITLDQTIFYPQGGGQPSDMGAIKVCNLTLSIQKVKRIGTEVRHYTDQCDRDLVGQKVLCSIDKDRRLLNAKLHTFGHLISNIIEKHCPHWISTKGHHFPDQCYVEFKALNCVIEEISLNLIKEEISNTIESGHLITQDQIPGFKVKQFCPNIAFTFPNEDLIRMIRIGEFPFSPCGGTHVKNLKELQGLKILKHKIKNNVLKIYYN